MDWKLNDINTEEVKNRIKKTISKDISKDEMIKYLHLVLSCIDLTTLEGKDTNSDIIEICKKAKSYNKNNSKIPNVAAVCFYPPFASLAKKELKGTGINIACVAGAFPSGQSPLDIRISEVKYAVENGANEIDMVISRGKFLENNYEYIYTEVKSIKKACGNAHLKVILETGELQSLSYIRLASEIAIAAGADFIKTSTGKISPAATLEAFTVMLDVIKTHYQKTGKMVGIKPAGGISETDVAIKYIQVLESVLGKKWMNKDYFRIGASRLADKVSTTLVNLI